jgi:hypothetical protein
MGVVVEDIRIVNEFTTNETNYLLGNIGDKVTIEVDFRAEEVFVTGAEEDIDRILLAPQPFRVNVADSKDIIYCEDATAFANYKVGDTYVLNIGGVNQTERYIYEKLSNQAFRVHTVGGSAGDTDFYATNGNVYDTSLSANDYIFLSTDLTAINYRWNFVENISGDYYRDKIASQLNQAKAAGVNNNDTVTVVPMLFDAPVTNNYGTISVKGNGNTPTAQKFTLTHETIITPFFLAGQESDLENGVSPSYLNAASSLKYVTSIDVGRNSNDPNFIETVDFSALDGNVGGYNENFNGNNNNYSVGSVIYKRLDTTVIDSIELVDDAQTVEIEVFDNKAVPNFSTSTEFSLNFCILPDDPDDYRNNNKTIVENFYFDRAKNVADGSSVSGDNLTTEQQIFSGVSATVDSASKITITGTIDLTTLGIADLSSKGFNYFLWVSIADHTKQTEESDRVSLIADIEPFFVDVSDDSLIAFDTKFLRHYESDTATEGTTTPIVRTEDDVLAYTQFTIDRLGRETDEILINSVDCELIAKKSDGSEFSLETFSQSLSGSLVVGDSQYIDTTIDRVFKMPNNEQRKQIKVNRRIDLDTTDLRYYEFAYPFLMRWEYWVALAGVNSDAFDDTLDNNGYNEDWQRYDTLTDWDLYYKTKVNLRKNGTLLSYENETQLTTFDYNEDSDWTNETIESLDANTDASTGSLLVSPTKIKASKDYAGRTPPALADVEWVIRIEVYEQGGISDIRYFSSVYDWSENSWFSSVDSSNKVVKSLVGSTYSAEVLIDADKLPDASEFKISARIYNESALAPITFCILQEDLEPILQENAIDCIEIEHT